MTTAQLWAAALTGTLLTTLLAGVKFAFDAVTGRRVRRVSDGKAELELAEMVKRVAADEVATLTVRLERTEAKSNRAHAELAALHRRHEHAAGPRRRVIDRPHRDRVVGQLLGGGAGEQQVDHEANHLARGVVLSGCLVYSCGHRRFRRSESTFRVLAHPCDKCESTEHAQLILAALHDSAAAAVRLLDESPFYANF